MLQDETNCNYLKQPSFSEGDTTRKSLKTLTDSQLRNNISLYANLKDKYSETIGVAFADVHVNGDNADILSKKII